MAKPVKLWLPAFLRFIDLIRIKSKDYEEPIPIVPFEAQKRFLRALTEGLDAGVHHLVCLKARQLGISTILLALDIFWLYMHPGLQGALIADTADNKDAFRQTITEMLESLPPRYRVPIIKHNRNELVLANGSRLQYMSAGKNKNSGLGRSRALNYVHATECSSWGDQKGLDSLVRALSEKNPNRLYIFESTALGYNLFFDMCEDAKEDSTKQFVFIGWWGKHTYRFERGTAEYERWWAVEPKLTEEEQEVFNSVKEQYGFEIDDEQWAYYRKLMASTDEHSVLEEMPSTEQQAFQATGNSFFTLRRITVDQDFIARRGVGYTGYRYTLGSNFGRLKVEKTMIPDEIDLRVWEEPVKEGQYVLGVDPAYGSDEDKDRSTISVWRCYADKLVQVAEYSTPWPETRQVAWVMAHLAGSYRNCVINLEITGPGGEVMVELQNLRLQMAVGGLRDIVPSLNPGFALDQARWFLYHRPDSMGPGYMFNWKQSFENKQRLLYRMRDNYDTEQLVPRSMLLLHEMVTFVQDGGKLHASGRNKDDRVMAASLANFAWAEWVRPTMMAMGQTFEVEQAKANERSLKGGTVIDWIIPQHFENAKRARAEEELRRIMEG